MKKILTSFMTMALVVTLSAPAYAAFTPSAEAKVAPEVITSTGSNGQEIAATIQDTKIGTVAQEVPTSELAVTSVAEKHKATVADITTMLTNAENKVKNAKVLTELTTDLSAALDAAKKNSTSSAIQKVTMEDLVVSDLFDISYIRDNAIQMIPDEHNIVFTIKTKLSQNDLFFVLHNYEDDKWEVVEDVKLAADGKLTITVDSLSPFAIVVDKTAYQAVDPSGPDSPKTGEVVNYAYLTGVVALLGAAAFLCLKGAKRKEA